MTAPSSTLPRVHLHTIPHGSALPDGSTVADGWPFLLETGTDPNIVRQLWQNQNGTWKLLGGLPVGGTTGQLLAKVDGTDDNVAWIDPPSSGAAAATSPSGATWRGLSTDTGYVYYSPNGGSWAFVAEFDELTPGENESTPWETPSSAGGTGVTGAQDQGWWAVGTNGADGDIAHTHVNMASGFFTGLYSKTDLVSSARLVQLPSTAGHYMGVTGRGTDMNNCYWARVDSTGTLTLAKVLAGVTTVIASGAMSAVAAVGDTVSISTVGTTITATVEHLAGGSDTFTATDSDLSTGTFVGMRMDGAGCEMTSFRVLHF